MLGHEMQSTETANELVRPIEPRVDDTMMGYAINTVPARPTSYPRQAGLTCGEFNARALIDAYGIEFTPDPSPRLRVRMFGMSFLSDLAATLVRHDLDAEVRTAAGLHEESQLALLRGHIDSHEPIILAIGNGHLSRDRDSAVARNLIGHFVTVYGYDAEREVFFVYDPYLEGDPPVPLPIGNVVRTADEILRDWRGPFYYRWIGMDHAYISVSDRA
jgi:hypothetical protein